jgi:hypothetical protein
MTLAHSARLGGVLLLLALPALGGVLLLLALPALRCGSRKGEVSGKVFFKGQVVPSGSITFLAEDGRNYFGVISETDHSYTIRGVPPGKVRIAVKSHPRVPEGLNPPWANKAPGTPPKARNEPAERVVKVPRKYESAEGSGLVNEVRPGPQVTNIVLPP